MDKTRIIKFLDSLEERGLMTANQQFAVLRSDADDVVAAGTNAGCINKNLKSCSGNINSRCTNFDDACGDSMNETCINASGGTIGTNKTTGSCGG